MVGTTHTHRLRNNAALTWFIASLKFAGKELPLEESKRETSSLLKARELPAVKGQEGPQAAFLKGWVAPESLSGFLQTL